MTNSTPNQNDFRLIFDWFDHRGWTPIEQADSLDTIRAMLPPEKPGSEE